ncbi:hypothetical protein X777_09215 [Ooceraea biroi]|uniref:DDE-1 domain-containing protein n=1 Tax=Ooceraea biroi TaxID=2015173 RepID=A0A026W767_OOCBI|nr:hypothetical protein X777_09215 [Ooceraea biroi]
MCRCQIYAVLKIIYNYEFSPTSLHRWKNLFREGREDIYYYTFTNTKVYKAIKDQVANARKVHNRNPSSALFIAKLSLQEKDINFVFADSKKDMIHGCVVPRKLTIEQKQARCDYCTDIIDTCDTNPRFLESTIVGSMTWFRVQSPERTARQQMMAFLCFYDSKGIIYHEFCMIRRVEEIEDIGEGEEATFSLYLWMVNVWRNINEKRSEYFVSGQPNFYFLLDKSLYSNIDVRYLCAENRVCVLHHLPHSPDLSPCDYFLFDTIRLKIGQQGIQHNYTTLEARIKGFMNTISDEKGRWHQSHPDASQQYMESIHQLRQRAQICKKLNGNYVDDLMLRWSN